MELFCVSNCLFIIMVKLRLKRFPCSLCKLPMTSADRYTFAHLRHHQPIFILRIVHCRPGGGNKVCIKTKDIRNFDFQIIPSLLIIPSAIQNCTAVAQCLIIKALQLTFFSLSKENKIMTSHYIKSPTVAYSCRRTYRSTIWFHRFHENFQHQRIQ